MKITPVEMTVIIAKCYILSIMSMEADHYGKPVRHYSSSEEILLPQKIIQGDLSRWQCKDI